ncbi:MAG: ATP-binding protein [Myxococcota bacterium]
MTESDKQSPYQDGEVPRHEPCCGLSPEQMCELMPLHLVVDRQLQVVQAGRGMQRFCPDHNGSLLSHFEPLAPKPTMTYDGLRAHGQTPLMLRSVRYRILLRCTVHNLGDQCLLIAVAPCLNPEGNASFSSSDKDNMTSDATEYVLLLHLLRSSLDDARQLSEQLQAQELRFKDAASQLEQMNVEYRRVSRRLEQCNQQLRELSYVISHDLREPIRMVESYSEILSDEYAETLDDEADRYLNYTHRGAQQALRLLHDLQSYTRAANHADSEFEAVCASTVVAEVVHDLRHELAEAQTEFAVDELATVRGIPAQIRQVFHQLLGNAIKFRADRPLKLHIAAGAGTTTFARFSIHDNGIGFNPKFGDRIFKIFKRLHTSEEYPGTGIGLSICRAIVEGHGGNIWAESTPGQGSVFHLELPTIPEPSRDR